MTILTIRRGHKWRGWAWVMVRNWRLARRGVTFELVNGIGQWVRQ